MSVVSRGMQLPSGGRLQVKGNFHWKMSPKNILRGYIITWVRDVRKVASKPGVLKERIGIRDGKTATLLRKRTHFTDSGIIHFPRFCWMPR